MAKKQPNPTLPDASVKIKGVTYSLAFTFGALAVVEQKLKSAGLTANMLQALDFSNVGAQKLAMLFYASLQPQHPAVTFEQASGMITMQNAARIFKAVGDAYVKSMAEPDEDDESPQKPE